MGKRVEQKITKLTKIRKEMNPLPLRDLRDLLFKVLAFHFFSLVSIQAFPCGIFSPAAKRV